jgi:Transposase, Mutator family
MAERARMTAAQLADKLLQDEHADVLLESVAWMARELMEADVSAKIGAKLGERSPERTTHRNGYRPRTWDTRVGSIELAIPKLRAGSYFPSFLEPRRRAEQALVAVVQEAYVNGVSTRKVDRLVQQVGLHHLGKDQVSRLCRGLDEQVRIFRERPLEGRYPYLWLDAKVERVREPGGVRHKALVVAYGVHHSGRREVIGLDVGEAETRGVLARSSSGACGPAAWTASSSPSPTPTPASRPPSPRCWAAPGSAHLCRIPVGGRVPPATFTAGGGPWQRDLRGPACRPVPPGGGGLGTGQWESCCEHRDERPAERAGEVAAL